jgi:predicted RNA binding protein YcfA (HicA-like mRNA interferase family)
MQDDKRLEGMRNNPRNDWTISDVEALCRSHGIGYKPPRKGSHAKVSHPRQAEILTIPFARPIKPVYIKKLVKFVDAVIAAKSQ